MEKSKSGKQLEIEVDCPLHPSNRIQAVNMGKSEGQLLFCLQCMFQQKDFSIMSDLKSFPELIAKATEVLNVRKEPFRVGEKSQEYLNLLSGKAEMMEKLNKHIEEEKKRTVTFFELMQQRLIALVVEKKDQCLKELDDQMTKLHDSFTEFEKQFNKAYFSEDNPHALFPGKTELEERLRNSTNFEKLKAFVKNLKEDIQVHENGKVDLRIFAERLLALTKQRPCYPENGLILFEFEKFSQSLAEFFENKIVLSDSLQNFTDNYFKGSIIVAKEQAEIIKNWLPLNMPFFPRLIYQSSRDGRNPDVFHKLCDGKRNTICLVSATFMETKKTGILGGFLDEPWSSDGKEIISKNTFLFCLTTETKCKIKNGKWAAKGKAGCGPIFGEGHDLYVDFEPGRSVLTSTWESSYEEVEKLVPGNMVPDGVLKKSGFFLLDMIDLEVYTLD